ALTAALRSDYPYFLSSDSWVERADALWGLSIDGKFDDAYFDELGRNSRFLMPESQAKVLLVAARANKGTTPVAGQLGDAIQGEILTELYQGKPRYSGLKTTTSIRSPLIPASEVQDLSTIVDALGRVRPNVDQVKLATDALVRMGKEDGWGQPWANASAM